MRNRICTLLLICLFTKFGDACANGYELTTDDHPVCSAILKTFKTFKGDPNVVCEFADRFQAHHGEFGWKSVNREHELRSIAEICKQWNVRETYPSKQNDRCIEKEKQFLEKGQLIIEEAKIKIKPDAEDTLLLRRRYSPCLVESKSGNMEKIYKYNLSAFVTKDREVVPTKASLFFLNWGFQDLIYYKGEYFYLRWLYKPGWDNLGSPTDVPREVNVSKYDELDVDKVCRIEIQ